jgi:hypothetical protein
MPLACGCRGRRRRTRELQAALLYQCIIARFASNNILCLCMHLRTRHAAAAGAGGARVNCKRRSYINVS